MLHPLRRRAALRRLGRARPAALLVACHGNICRSPFAAGLLRRELREHGTRVESAGFVGPDRPPPAEALAAAARRGVDLSSHRSCLLVAPLVRPADRIVVMEPAQRRAVCDRFGRQARDVVVLGDLDPEPIETRGIRDPVNGPAEAFEECYARIERCVRELARAIVGAPGGTG